MVNKRLPDTLNMYFDQWLSVVVALWTQREQGCLTFSWIFYQVEVKIHQKQLDNFLEVAQIEGILSAGEQFTTLILKIKK